jgi:uncharacterized protein (DUF58 family)
VIDRYTAAFLVVALAAGVWWNQVLIVLVAAFGLILGGANLLWTHRCLDGVEYQRSLGTPKALWGETTSLTVRIANRKLLPLTWLRTEDFVPERLRIDGAHIVYDQSLVFTYLATLSPILPFEQIVRRYTIHCRQRGLFTFGPVTVESGDLLARHKAAKVLPGVETLLVYPKLFDLHVPKPLSHRMIGRMVTRRAMLEDPSRVVGAREYRPGDPLRRIEWRASARMRELMVRISEPTTDVSLGVFLNFKGRAMGYQELYPAQLEFAISLAASLARWGLDRKCPVGVFGNGSRGPTGSVRVPIAAGGDQLRRILEALAVATPFGEGAFGPLLVAEARRLPFEAALVVVSSIIDGEVAAAVAEVARQRPITILKVGVGDAPRPPLPGVQLIEVPYEENWENIQALSLAG